jgi:Flp pilus assembly protein TadD
MFLATLEAESNPLRPHGRREYMEIVQILPRVRELLGTGDLIGAVSAFENLLRSQEEQESGQAGFETENLYPLYCALCVQADKSNIPLTWLQKALNLDPDLNERFLWYNKELLRKGRNQEALEISHKLCQLRPEDHRTWLALAEILVREERLEEAESHMQRALALTDGALETYLEIARLYIDGGQPEEAGTLLCTLVEQGVRTHQVLDVLFCLYEGQMLSPDDATAAKELFRTRKAKIHLNLAWLRYTEGDLPGAARLFRSAIDLDGSNPQIFLDLKQAVPELSADPDPDCIALCEVYEALREEFHHAKS